MSQPELKPAGSAFGLALRTIRQAHGLSQKQLAKRMGYDNSYISKLESGARAYPLYAVLQRLEEVVPLTPVERATLYRSAGYEPPLATDDIHQLVLELYYSFDQLYRVDRETYALLSRTLRRMLAQAADVVALAERVEHHEATQNT